MDTSNREFRVRRKFNAPVNLVWEAFTSPEKLVEWWGPIGFTNTIHKMEVKPDGIWSMTMHGPDGTDYANESIFLTVEPLKILSFKHISEPVFITTVHFEGKDDTTEIEFHQLFENEKQFKQIVETYKADEGLQQTLNRLENFLLK
jgi:uncharacterized protein YndB with AHSA1/START domain